MFSLTHSPAAQKIITKGMWHIRLVYISGMGVGVRHRQRDKETEIEKTLPCSLLYYIMTWLSPMGTSDIRVFLVI